MRQLKFRVWSPLLNRFAVNTEFTHILYQEEDFRSGTFEVTSSEGEVIQQFTGLLDSNGKEIYEGDIIKETWKENYPYGYNQGEWEDNEDIYQIKYEAPSFVFRKRGNSQSCVKNFRREVIGNIFKNEDLLE